MNCKRKIKGEQKMLKTQMAVTHTHTQANLINKEKGNKYKHYIYVFLRRSKSM